MNFPRFTEPGDNMTKIQCLDSLKIFIEALTVLYQRLYKTSYVL